MAEAAVPVMCVVGRNLGNRSCRARAESLIAGPLAVVPVVLLIVLFVWLPVLARAHDSFSITDQPTKFRISRNLDRPHPKLTLSPVLAVVARLGTDDRLPLPSFIATSDHTSWNTRPSLTPLPVRAPPHA